MCKTSEFALIIADGWAKGQNFKESIQLVQMLSERGSKRKLALVENWDGRARDLTIKKPQKQTNTLTGGKSLTSWKEIEARHLVKYGETINETKRELQRTKHLPSENIAECKHGFKKIKKINKK